MNKYEKVMGWLYNKKVYMFVYYNDDGNFIKIEIDDKKGKIISEEYWLFPALKKEIEIIKIKSNLTRATNLKHLCSEMLKDLES